MVKTRAKKYQKDVENEECLGYLKDAENEEVDTQPKKKRGRPTKIGTRNWLLENIENDYQFEEDDGSDNQYAIKIIIMMSMS